MSSTVVMRHPRLILEFGFFFALLPGFLAFFNIRSSIFVILWLVCLLALYWLHKHASYNLREDWNAQALTRPVVRGILLRFLPFAAAMLIFVWQYDPGRLFDLPMNRPLLWLTVLALYPLLSVFPQEILFRSFMFRRYPSLFTSSQAMLAASALSFGWVHIVMHTWIAVAFSMIGGWLFATTYARTRSLAAVCFEHMLYGCYVFTIGLGWYFYHANGVH